MQRLVASIAVLVLLLGMLLAWGRVQAAPISPSITCPTFNSGDFANPTRITNRYFPLTQGTTFIYTGVKEGTSVRDDVVVTPDTKQILGLTTVVVKDTVWVAGKLDEFTIDWYGQDKFGNVWYFGEFATQYKNGKPVGHAGSWEAGVNGATPGIIMEGKPRVGDAYCQESAPGVAEDQAQVLSLNKSVCVPFGCFDKVLQTKDFSPLEPAVVEHKYFALGIGMVKTIMVKGGMEQIQLMVIKTGQ